MIYKAVSFVLVVFMSAGCGRDFEKPGTPQVTLLKGRVVADDSQPVNGARVRLLECGLSALTGQDGRFFIEDVPNGDYTISAEAQLKVNDELLDLVVIGSEPEPLRGAVRDLPQDLVLQKTGEIRGTLSVSDSTSPLGAVVYLEGGSVLAPVSDDGTFVLRGVPAGKWYVGASKAGYQLVINAEKESVKMQPGGSLLVSLQLEPMEQNTSAAISGLVYLSNPGPEKGVEVVLSDLFASTEYRTFTDRNGAFSLSMIPAGLYELRARHDGYRQVGLALIPLRDGDDISLERPLILPKDQRSGPSYPWDGDPSGNLDDDGDGIDDTQDNCPLVFNPAQVDWDGDGAGNACDPEPGFSETDPDGDGVEQGVDNCPNVANSDQANLDKDPLGDACDPDIDNDGWMNSEDKCPYMADALNDDTICNWSSYLIYSAQEENSGDIYLYRGRMQSNHLVTERFNTGPGQSWGAVVTDDGWVFYHHRAQAGDKFRLYAIRVDDLDAEPISFADWDWGDAQEGDVMNPSVCTDPGNSTTWMFYERHMSDGENQGWRIFATVVSPDIAQTPPGQELVLDGVGLHQAPPRELLNYRYPSCHWDTQTMLLAHAVDFVEDSGTGIFDLTQTWSAWLTNFENGIARSITPLDPYDSSGSQQLAVIWSSDGWIFERKEGGRVDLYRKYGEYTQPLVANGARNLHPAFLPMGDGTRGIVAFQSDVDGSFDVYLMKYPDGAPAKVTHVDGWAGSPNWYHIK